MRNFGKKQPGVSDAHSAGGQVINGGTKIFIKAKLVKGLHGIGCTISEQGVITAIEPNGVVATRGELALGDKIVEVNKMPVQFGSIHETLSKGSAWDVGVERSPNVHVGPADYSLQYEQQQKQKLRSLQTAAPAPRTSQPSLPSMPAQPQVQHVARAAPAQLPPAPRAQPTDASAAEYFALFEAQGFERSRVQAALDAHNGDVNRAADWLLSGGHSTTPVAQTPPPSRAQPPPQPSAVGLLGDLAFGAAPVQPPQQRSPPSQLPALPPSTDPFASGAGGFGGGDFGGGGFGGDVTNPFAPAGGGGDMFDARGVPPFGAPPNVPVADLSGQLGGMSLQTAQPAVQMATAAPPKPDPLSVFTTGASALGMGSGGLCAPGMGGGGYGMPQVGASMAYGMQGGGLCAPGVGGGGYGMPPQVGAGGGYGMHGGGNGMNGQQHTPGSHAQPPEPISADPFASLVSSAATMSSKPKPRAAAAEQAASCAPMGTMGSAPMGTMGSAPMGTMGSAPMGTMGSAPMGSMGSSDDPFGMGGLDARCAANPFADGNTSAPAHGAANDNPFF